MNQSINREIMEISIEDIVPNRFQPRLTFDTEALNELATSIKEHGIIQPLVVRKLQDKFEIIAGERRYKAATLVGMKKVPCIVMELSDNESAEVAVIENIQRKEMTPLEEAKSFKKILDKGYLTQEELAKRMGKSQSSIANKLRLLNLDEVVQDAILEGKISERHARSLLKIENKQEQRNVLSNIINNRLTVKQTDDLIKEKYGKGVDIIESSTNFNKQSIDNMSNIQNNNQLNEINSIKNTNQYEMTQSNISSIFKEPEPVKPVTNTFVEVPQSTQYMSTPEVNIPVNNITNDVNPQLNLMNNLGMVNNNQLFSSETSEPKESISNSSLDIFKFDTTTQNNLQNNVDIQSIISPSVLSNDSFVETEQNNYAVNDYYRMNNVSNIDINQMKNTAQDINPKEEKKEDISNLLTINNKPENKFFVDLDVPTDIDAASLASLPFKVKNAVQNINKKIDELKLQGTNIVKEETDLGNTYQIVIRIDK